MFSSHVVYFSPAQRFDVDDCDDDPEVANGNARVWGLPNNKVVSIVAQAILHTIAAQGIDPAAVVLSGYDRDDTENAIDGIKEGLYISTERDDIKSHISEHALMLNELYETGRLSPSVKAAKTDQIRVLRERLKIANATKPLSTYYFAGHIAMLDNLKGDKNPIFYAGGGEGATIGIYDRVALATLSAQNDVVPDQFKFLADPDHAYSVSGTLAQIESAKLMECHIGYY